MSSTGISEFPAAGIGKLLADGRFEVPNHQRDYSWSEDEVKQLFDDIDDAMARGDEFYFLGLMVFMHTGTGALTVLDGQQRLATTVLFLAAIRSWLQRYSEHRDDAKQIQFRFIGSTELGERSMQSRLVMNAANNQAFAKYVVAEVPVEEIRSQLSGIKPSDRNRRLLEAAVYCHERVASFVARCASSDDAAAKLLAIVRYIRDSASVARLTVSSEGAAFTIFETLNDRGLELAPMDLVKNYLFGQAERHSKPRIRDMEQRWAQMMSTLAAVKPAAFLRAFWTSRHGRVQMHNLYASLKATYTDPESAVDLSIEMLSAAEQFVAIDSPDDAVWGPPFAPSVRDKVRSLKVLRSQIIGSIILAALARMEPRETERLMRLLEVLLVRYQLVGGGRTGLLEIACARLAHAIYKREVRTATEAYKSLQDIYPRDDEFQAKFREKDEPNGQKAQYLLRGLEVEERRLAQGAMAGESEVSTSLTVEHILPKKPGDDWQSVVEDDPAIVEDCANRLGNLCLLTKINRELGQKGFEVKAALYRKSDLIITKKVADTGETWGREQISKRQAHLAKLAVSAWRFQ